MRGRVWRNARFILLFAIALAALIPGRAAAQDVESRTGALQATLASLGLDFFGRSPGPSPSGAGEADSSEALPAAIGQSTKLPLPRYVSLKNDKVNLREGPSKDHSTRWVYQRAGLPVEIIAEFDNWRRVRDAEGADGWVWHSLLSGRRTAIVAPWDRGTGQPIDMHEEARTDSRIVARLEPGVVAGVRGCDRRWCRLSVQRGARSEIIGFIPQDRLWGVYPGEAIN